MSQYDQLWITGTAALDGTLNISLLPGFDIDAGDTFEIIHYSSYEGSFASIKRLNPDGSIFFTSEYRDTGLWLTANYDQNPVPIPATLWLFGSGLLGLMGIRRRRTAGRP